MNLDNHKDQVQPGLKVRVDKSGQPRTVEPNEISLRYSVKYGAMTFLSVVLALGPWCVIRAEDKATPRYVGMSSCKPCHSMQYQSFSSHAKKSSSFQSINRLRKELTPEEIRGCYACHTTGYGKPGGFVSEEATPDLKNAGCEVCHGPGELHVRTQDPRDIKGHLNEQDCEVCHISDRVKAFRYKPLIRGGAH